MWNKLPQKEASIETIRADQEKGTLACVCENVYAVMCVHMCINVYKIWLSGKHLMTPFDLNFILYKAPL